MTFSIVARDPLTGALGAATATAGPAVGALVLHGHARAGAIATQAMTNPLYGIRGLALLQKGLSAAETLKALLLQDSEAAQRQVMIVDRQGGFAHWSGEQCGDYFATLQATDCLLGGNLLTDAQILNEMQRAYQAQDKLPFADRLLTAMRAGAAAGGDRRGLKSAALKIWHDREYASIDLRADWSDAPLALLEEILHQTREPLYADFFAVLPKGRVD